MMGEGDSVLRDGVVGLTRFECARLRRVWSVSETLPLAGTPSALPADLPPSSRPFLAIGPSLDVPRERPGSHRGCLLSAVVLRPEASKGGEQRLGCRVAIDLVAKHGYEQL